MRLRFLFSSDVEVDQEGWFLDDLGVDDVLVGGTCTPQQSGPLFADGFESGTTSAWSVTTGG